MITRGDKILIAVLIILSVASMPFTILSLGAKGAATEVVVLSGREEVVREPLGEQKKFGVKGPLGTTVVQIKSGKVRVISSPCPQHICMAEGWINRPGEIIVCAPNRVVVKLESPKADKTSPDVMSR